MSHPLPLMRRIDQVATEQGWSKIDAPAWRPTWRREWTAPDSVEWRQHLEIRAERDRQHVPARLTVIRWCDTEDPTHEFLWDLAGPLDVFDAALVILRSQPQPDPAAALADEETPR